MRKKITDKEIDIMLRSYCERKGHVAFDAEFDKKRRKTKRAGFVTVATSVFAVVLIFGLVFSQIVNTSDTSTANTVPRGFSISASAAQREPVTMSNVEVELCPKDEKGLGGDIAFEDGMVSIEPIWFSMSGKEVETFDYKCENGTLYYVIPDLKNEMLEGDDTITQDDYFSIGKELDNIPYNSEDPNYIFVSWYSYRLEEEASQYFNKDISQIEDEDMRNYRKEKLKTDDDFSYYFGDTITVTAHYKDDTKETAVIEVTVDTREDSDVVYGNYVLQYK